MNRVNPPRLPTVAQQQPQPQQRNQIHGAQIYPKRAKQITFLQEVYLKVLIAYPVGRV